jgi:hypothetical protein
MRSAATYARHPPGRRKRGGEVSADFCVGATQNAQGRQDVDQDEDAKADNVAGPQGPTWPAGVPRLLRLAMFIHLCVCL